MSPRRANGAGMNRFAQLFTALDQTTKTTRKTDALADYFREAPEPDRLWTIALLSGRRPQTDRDREPAGGVGRPRWRGLPMWLFSESYDKVGDLAETIHLVLPPPGHAVARSLSDWIAEIRGLGAAEEPEKRRAILAAWDALGGAERFVYNKLITGGFRVGVSQKLMTRALAPRHRDRGGGAGAPDHGRLVARDGHLSLAHHGPRSGGGPVAALPVLPGLRDRGDARPAGGSRGLAGGMEVGTASAAS